MTDSQSSVKERVTTLEVKADSVRTMKTPTFIWWGNDPGFGIVLTAG